MDNKKINRARKNENMRIHSDRVVETWVHKDACSLLSAEYITSNKVRSQKISPHKKKVKRYRSIVRSPAACGGSC